MTVTKHERSDAVANRVRILGAARQVFAQRGMDAEVREIAECAGVGVGTLYRHFANREDLFAALLQETLTLAITRAREAAQCPDARDAVRAVVMSMAETHTRFGALLEAMSDPRAQHACPPHQDFAELAAVMTGIVQHGVETGVFRTDVDVPVAVAMMLHSIGVFSVLAGERTHAETAASLTSLFLAALGSR